MNYLESVLKKFVLSLFICITLFTADNTTVHGDHQKNNTVSTYCEEYPMLDHNDIGR